MIQDIIDIEDQKFSILKTVEELAELQEVLVKIITKPVGALEGERLQHLIEELGDVNLRTFILTKRLGLIQQVSDRRLLKQKEVLDAYKANFTEVL